MSIERIKQIKSVVDQIINRLPSVRGKGEEATKQALVLPMLDILGYDIWNPSEVCPEYDADFATKKAGPKEKVDIAIVLNSKPRIFIEIKSIDESLKGHLGQLKRYFSSTESVTLGILTNGVEWRFYTDTGNPNLMDNEPFYIAKLDAPPDQGWEVLTRFMKTAFNAEQVRDYATELLYAARMVKFLRQELIDPSEYFIRWILKSKNMYDGVVNGNVIDRFKPIGRAALTSVIREIVGRSIYAMDKEASQSDTGDESLGNGSDIEKDKDKNPDDSISDSLEEKQLVTSKSSIFTTKKELQVFDIVKEQFQHSALANATIHDTATRKDVPIVLKYKDTVGYLGIYFNKPSWWVMRVVVEAKTNWIGFNVDENIGIPLIPKNMVKLDSSQWADFRVAINQPEDIHKLHRLVFTAFQKKINDRMHQGEKESERSLVG